MATYNYNVGTAPNYPPYRMNTYLRSDWKDVYSFTMNDTRSINLNLHNITSGDDADLRLFRDSNNNGILDNSDQWLQTSNRTSNSDDSINYRATPGRYFAEVTPYSLGGDGRLDYTLDISATPQYPSSTTAPNLLPEEIDLGSIRLGTILLSDPNQSRTMTRSGSVGNNNTADNYRFTASSRGDGVEISASLTGLSSDADIRLVQDRDRDQIVDPDEILASSWLGGTSSESLSYSLWNYQLSQGDCFVQVCQHSGDTNYNLSMTFESILM
jgi:Bacterial pre-peptidase C-terminal domain